MIEARFTVERPDFRLEVDLALPARGITMLFGASGSGKTTLLRCVAGLERAGRGRLVVAGDTWQDDARGLFVPTHRRALGYVFQEASLFPHLDVAANVAFGQKRSQADAAAARAQPLSIPQVIELLGIGALLRRRPSQLSGGERQRVAIARALATNPRLLLLDEPLAALDHARKQDILPYLERLRDELDIPMLYVSHAAAEVARLADTLVVLDAGQVRASGPVGETLARLDLPVMLGEDAGALLEGTVDACDAPWHLARVAFDGGALWVRDTGVAPGQRVRVRVLARDVSIATALPQDTSIQNLLPCTVAQVGDDSHPAQALVRLQAGGSPLLARITRRAVHTLGLVPGRAVWAQVKSAALVE